MRIGNSKDEVEWHDQFTWDETRHNTGEELVVCPATGKYIPGGRDAAEKDRAEHWRVSVCPSHKAAPLIWHMRTDRLISGRGSPLHVPEPQPHTQREPEPTPDAICQMSKQAGEDKRESNLVEGEKSIDATESDTVAQNL